MDNSGKFYATGKRKNAIARVWLKVGKGKIVVNKKTIDQYFPSETYVKTILQPFVLTKTIDQYDVICTVRGGGISGQKGAILHGISKALDKSAPDFHAILRKGGLLTRDSRVVERKKYGQRKARKKTQFSKR
ncbi:30S ribosomal protein S9 [Rickettsia asembonensis]|uniref:Small ribosomal subunit protein uS9 n=1 Tax=Rickettsia asembonensis TaxID=1068590 RepID=A0A0C2QY03_9RICK|nr:30S ribosomal protein S9 [Rickettsia asembonensis]